MYKIDRRGGAWGVQKSFNRTDPKIEAVGRSTWVAGGLLSEWCNVITLTVTSNRFWIFNQRSDLESRRLGRL